MSNITIIKGKLLKDAVEINYIKRDKDGDAANCSEEHKATAHPDLKNAFDKLKKHIAYFVAREFISIHADGDIENLEVPKLDKFNISGFTIYKGEDMAGVILTGQLSTGSGKPLGFNTPVISFEEDLPDAYPFITDLVVAVNECKSQLKLYMGGKHGDPAQTEIPFDQIKTDGLEDGETNDAEENKRIAAGILGAAQRRGRKKKAAVL